MSWRSGSQARSDKQSLIAADPDKFFTEPHYNGFPAILVRLPAIEVAELDELLDRRLANPGPEGARHVTTTPTMDFRSR